MQRGPLFDPSTCVGSTQPTATAPDEELDETILGSPRDGDQMARAVSRVRPVLLGGAHGGDNHGEEHSSKGTPLSCMDMLATSPRLAGRQH